MVEYSHKYEWTQKLADIPIDGDKTLMDLFVYKGNTLWFFFNKYLHNRLFNTLKASDKMYPISRVLYNIDNKVDINKPKRVSTSVFTSYINMRIRNRYYNKKEDMNIKGKNILLRSDQFIAHNFWDELLKVAEDDLKVIDYDRFWNLKSVLNVSKYDNHLGSFYDKKTFKEIKEVYSFILQTWKDLRKNEYFKELFKYEGMEFFLLVEPYFNFIFKVIGLYVAEAWVVGKNIVRENPRAIVMDSEENLYGQACILHAKNTNIKTVALSYESIYDGCLHCHIKNKQILDRKSDIWRPLPTVKVVTNKKEKDLLVKKGNYPSSIIKVLGNIRFDELKNYKPKMNFITTFKDVGPTIFFAPSLRDKDVDTTVVMQAPLNSILFINVHPNINMKKFIKYFKKLLQKNGRDDLHVTVHKNKARDLIFLSDLAIIDNSSVGVDAILLNKPLISINKEKETIIDFGNAITNFDVYDDKLNSYFDNMDNENFDSKDNARKTYIKNNFENFGDASKKILKEILK